MPFGKGLKPCSQPSRPDLMFPNPKDEEAISEALFACGLCDVRERCLAEALKRSVANDHGIWGGTTEVERRSLRRRLQREAREARKSVSEPSVWPRPSRTFCPRWAGPAFPPV
jgi:WhiB family redox-sensing transcriptional regulator